MVAALTVEDIAGMLNGEVEQIEIADIIHVEIGLEPGRAWPIGGLHDNRKLGSAMPVFPIFGKVAFRVVTSNQLDPITGSGKGSATRNALPGGGSGTQGLVTIDATGVIVAVDRINPQIGHSWGADWVFVSVDFEAWMNG